MTRPSDPVLLVLHALRLKGLAETTSVAATSGLVAHEVEAILTRLARDEAVLRREGRVSGWALTSLGRREHDRRLRAEVDQSGGRAQVESAYHQFLALNPELLALCTDWQMRPGPDGQSVLNDHSDADYDTEVIARLDRVHSQAVPICTSLAGVFARFSPYQGRLSAALERAHAGEVEWVTRPLIDSYHTVWFELHEDLLLTLRFERKEVEA